MDLVASTTAQLDGPRVHRPLALAHGGPTPLGEAELCDRRLDVSCLFF